MNLRLIEARKRKGLKQNELADLVHVSRQAYSLYEKGVRHPGWETTAAIAQALEVSVDYLLGLSDDPLPAIPLSARERTLLETYQILDERGKAMIDITLREQSRYRVSAEDKAAQTADPSAGQPS